MKTLEEIMDFMEENFNGNLQEVSIMAYEKVKEKGLINGPLWEEIGTQTMKELFKKRRLHPGRRSVSRRSEQKDAPESKARNGNAMAWWVSIDGKWYNLLDLYKEDVEELACCYDKLAKTNGFERDFYLEVASRLKSGQMVKDVFDYTSLKELRKKV